MSNRSVAAIVVLSLVAVGFMPSAFVAAPSQKVDVNMAGLVAAGAALPQAAGAFTFEGEEYFDIWFGVSPAAWGLCAFIILTFAGLLKTSLTKYNKPISKEPLKKKFVPLQKERPQNFTPDLPAGSLKGFDTSF
eukprot:CAMPEP_0178399906 /NCGR_PEP_ID=MMETSP0689_2-20121128/15517_1 /TAXON_ID=160604 /ORGANISM="Amphidinium massartii, Strain CS-259" /LENGTH=133 /DNA_ID=CAMNT_0020020689 /DNA_START=79 /DNA_END=480 /DNA_ORIENTATION=+